MGTAGLEGLTSTDGTRSGNQCTGVVAPLIP
jgi:hypothetical protein